MYYYYFIYRYLYFMQQFLSNAVIAISLIVSTWMISVFGIKLINNSVNQTVGEIITNTINVDAIWKVTAAPDVIFISISASQAWKTSAQAQQFVNISIDQVKTILKQAQISDKNIKSTNISVYPEYIYNNNTSQISWYRANHTLDIEIMMSGGQTTIAEKIIDDIITIDNVQVNSIVYDIKDKAIVYQKAREHAFIAAKEKALQLATLGWLVLKKPVSINESINQSIHSTPMFRHTMSMDKMSSESQWSSISPGQMDVELALTVVRGVE